MHSWTYHSRSFLHNDSLKSVKVFVQRVHCNPLQARIQHFKKGGRGVLLLRNIQNVWPVSSSHPVHLSLTQNLHQNHKFKLACSLLLSLSLLFSLTWTTVIHISTMTSSATFYSAVQDIWSGSASYTKGTLVYWRKSPPFPSPALDFPNILPISISKEGSMNPLNPPVYGPALLLVCSVHCFMAC